MKPVNPYEGQGPAWAAKRRAWEEGAAAMKGAIFLGAEAVMEEWAPPHSKPHAIARGIIGDLLRRLRSDFP